MSHSLNKPEFSLERSRQVRRYIVLGLAATLLLVWLVVVFLFDARLFGLFFNSVSLAILTALGAIPVGTAIAFSLVRTNLPCKRLQAALVASLLTIPLILTASAWDAGFGRLGWLQWWVTGDFSGRTIDGWNAVVLIHAFAAFPWVVAISAFVFGTRGQAMLDAARLDGRASQLFGPVILRELVPAVGLSFGWIFLQTFSEMVVTDLYQVRTYAEEIYLSLPYGQVLWMGGPNALQSESPDSWLMHPLNIGLLICVVCLGWVWAEHLLARIRWWWNDDTPMLLDLGSSRWLWGGISGGLILLATLVPIANLIVKTGFVVTPSEGQATVTWSLTKVIEQVAKVPERFSEEIGWSLLICSVTSGLVMTLSILIAWVARQRQWFRFLTVGLTAILWLLPGPLVGVLVITMLNQNVPLLVELYDRTILAPVVACGLRVWPIAFCMVLAIQSSVPDDQLEVAKSDGMGIFRQLWSIVLPQRTLVLLGTSVAIAMLAFGELSASILVIPPGMETVPRRIFGLLHAGVDDQAASLCLLQWGALFLISVTLFVILLPKARTRDSG